MIYNTVTGKKLPNQTNNDGKLTSLNLSRALAEDPIPCKVAYDKSAKMFENGSHPAARNGNISICITKCMQSLMNHCLSEDTRYCPSAEGICGRLIVCCGPSTQERIITNDNDTMHKAVLLPENASGSILGWTVNGKLLTINPSTWAVCSISVKNIEALARCITLVGKLLVVCTNACKVHIMTMADFSDHYISIHTVPSTPTCIFASNDCLVIVVGLVHGKLAIFKSKDSEMLLTNPPVIVKLLERSYCKKGIVNCGIVLSTRICCSNGRYLIGLEKESLHQLFSMPLSTEGNIIVGMELCGSHLWVWFDSSGEIAICDHGNGMQINSIDIR